MWHPDMPEEYKNQIVTGDCRELATRIPDESIDLIFTDPPYPKEYLYLFEWLGQTAKRILKPSGLLITLTGHHYFDKVFAHLNKFLIFYWIGGMKHSTGSVSRLHPKQMLCSWKPALWFAKNRYREHPYVFDIFQGRGRDKQFHKWGQDASWFCYYLDKLTTKADVIFDPFTGGGTVPAVCKQLERNHIAFEIDPDTAEMARERVLNTQPPLFVMKPEQLELQK